MSLSFILFYIRALFHLDFIENFLLITSWPFLYFFAYISDCEECIGAIFFINPFVFFIVGAIIGWIIGKVKNRR